MRFDLAQVHPTNAATRAEVIVDGLHDRILVTWLDDLDNPAEQGVNIYSFFWENYDQTLPLEDIVTLKMTEIYTDILTNLPA